MQTEAGTVLICPVPASIGKPLECYDGLMDEAVDWPVDLLGAGLDRAIPKFGRPHCPAPYKEQGAA